MYDKLKIKLIFMVLNGCKFAEWHFFNRWCQNKLTAREYGNIKKTSEYKRLFNYFGRV